MFSWFQKVCSFKLNLHRYTEERLIVAESAAAQQPELLSRLRQLERRVALAEAARNEAEGGGRGEAEAIESRVAYVQQAVSRADGVMAELRGRLEAAERDASESRAQVMRVEAAAAVAMSGARDSFEQIQQRIGGAVYKLNAVDP